MCVSVCVFKYIVYTYILSNVFGEFDVSSSGLTFFTTVTQFAMVSMVMISMVIVSMINIPITVHTENTYETHKIPD